MLKLTSTYGGYTEWGGITKLGHRDSEFGSCG